MKPTRVWAQFKPNADETYAVSVTIGASWPDAIDEARVTVQRIMDHMVETALEQYGDTPAQDPIDKK